MFITLYIRLLKKDNDNLVSFLNNTFNYTENNIFEFLFNIFKTSSNDEWSFKNFLITVMNLAVTIKDQGSSNFYHYLLLTNSSTPTPIYNLLQTLNNNPPPDEINHHFIQEWNTMIGKETFASTATTSSKTFKMSKMLSKNTRYTILFTMILLFIILGVCGAYFTNKYGKPQMKTSMGTLTSMGTPVDF